MGDELEELLHDSASVPDADAARALAVARQRLLGGAQPEMVAAFGRYRLGEPLGAGGMGRVFAARDETLGRDVAVKLLRGGLPADGLRDEARALAALSHPNIVTVFDLGPTGVADEIFIVMERVHGTTLRRWLETPRDAAEILAVFTGVGRGLAAAHRRGIVHGDVKPDNAIVTADGTAKVLDFGLARLGVIADGALRTVSQGDDVSVVPSKHVRGGTPRYMAPEQRAGALPDARSDQYSFCVALREALPAGANAAIARGLAEDPDLRWPTMDALVDALEPRAPRWRVPAIVGTTAALAIAWAMWPRAGASSCEPIASSWTDARRDALQAAFDAVGTPYARSHARRTAAELDARAEAIAQTWSTACTDAKPEVRACLVAADGEMGAVVDALVAGGPPALERAFGTVALLGDASLCASPSGAPTIAAETYAVWRADLAKTTVALNDARGGDALAIARRVHAEATKAGAARIAAEARWLEGAAISVSGEGDAVPVLTDAIEAAGVAGNDTIEITAIADLVGVLRMRGELDDAERWVRRGGTVADRMRASDPYRARLAVEHGHIERARGDDASAAARYGDAIAILRSELGDDHPMIGIALNGIGSIALGKGDHASARKDYCEAERILIGAFGKDTPRTIETAINCAIGMSYAEPDAARTRLLELVEVAERFWGRDDARVGNALANLASVELRSNELQAAIPHMRRSDAIVAKTLGEAHPNRVIGMLNLGFALLDLPDAAGAEQVFAQALALGESSLGEHIAVAEAWAGLARARIGLGKTDAAIEAAERAVAMQEKVATDPTRLAESKSVLAQALVAAGRDVTRASALARAALAAFEGDPALDRERARAQAVLASSLPGDAVARQDARTP